MGRYFPETRMILFKGKDESLVKQVNEWKEQNPKCKILSYKTGRRKMFVTYTKIGGFGNKEAEMEEDDA